MTHDETMGTSPGRAPYGSSTGAAARERDEDRRPERRHAGGPGVAADEARGEAHGPAGDAGAAKRSRDDTHRGWLIFFAFVIAMAAVAFGFKFYEFFLDLTSQEGFRFAGAHLATYLLVSAGFFLLLAHAFLRGHFADIEQPKHDLLEQERRYDRDEFERRRPARG